MNKKFKKLISFLLLLAVLFTMSGFETLGALPLGDEQLESSVDSEQDITSDNDIDDADNNSLTVDDDQKEESASVESELQDKSLLTTQDDDEEEPVDHTSDEYQLTNYEETGQVIRLHKSELKDYFDIDDSKIDDDALYYQIYSEEEQVEIQLKEGGKYYFGISENTSDVKIIGCSDSTATPNEVYIDCSHTTDSVNITIENLYNYATNNVNIIECGVDHSLDLNVTFQGTNIFDYVCKNTESKDSIIHVFTAEYVNSTLNLVLADDSKTYMYHAGNGACIGGNTGEANGNVTLQSQEDSDYSHAGSLFINDTGKGACVGAGNNSECSQIPGEISFNSGDYYFMSSKGYSIGGAGGDDASRGTGIIVNGGTITTNQDYLGSSIGGACYDSNDAGSGGYFSYYMGSIRTYINKCAGTSNITGWENRLLSEGVNDAVITANHEELYGCAIPLSSIDEGEIYSIFNDGVEIYNGTGHLYRYAYDSNASASGAIEGFNPTAIMGQWTAYSDDTVYLYLMGGTDHTLEINGNEYIVKWDEDNKCFYTNFYHSIKDGTYHIASKKAYDDFVSTINNGITYEGLTVSLDCNLDFSNDEEFAAIDGFAGTFEGNGHIVQLKELTTDEYKGLFTNLTGTVNNLTICGEHVCVDSLEYHEKLDPTCTENGYEEYWKCNICGKLYSDSSCENETTLSDLKIAATKHSLVWHLKVPSTCTEEGLAEYWECTKCNKVFMDELGNIPVTLAQLKITKLVHTANTTTGSLEKVPIVEPTCSESGHQTYWKCKCCGELFSDEYGKKSTTLEGTVIAPKGHQDYNNNPYANDPSRPRGSGGSYEENELTLMDYSTLTCHEYQDSTCTVDGNYKYFECKDCGKIFIDGNGKQETTLDYVTIKATGHKSSNPSYEWVETDDGWNCKATATCENFHTNKDKQYQCSEPIKEVVTAKLVDEVAPTHLSEGCKVYEANFADSNFKTQRKTVTISKLTYQTGDTVLTDLVNSNILQENAISKSECFSQGIIDADTLFYDVIGDNGEIQLKAGGKYYLRVTSPDVKKIKIIGCADTTSAPNELYLDCAFASSGLNIEIENLYNYSTNGKANIIEAPTAGGSLAITFKGTNILDYASTDTESKDSIIHIPTPNSLSVNLADGSKTYLYSTANGACIGGNTGETNGKIMFSSSGFGELFVNNTGKGSCIGAGLNSDGSNTPGEIDFKSGSYYLMTSEKGYCIGGTPATSGTSNQTVIRIEGAAVTTNQEITNPSVGGSGYVKSNSLSAGKLIYTGGSIRTYIDKEAGTDEKKGYNDMPLTEGVNEAVITAARYLADGTTPVYYSAITVPTISDNEYYIIKDKKTGEVLYTGNGHKFRYKYDGYDSTASASGATGVFSPKSIMGEWTSYTDNTVYLFLTGADHNLEIVVADSTGNKELIDYAVKWDAGNSCFYENFTRALKDGKYYINSNKAYDEFASTVAGGVTYDGQDISLGCNLDFTAGAGVTQIPESFKGTFAGNNHTVILGKCGDETLPDSLFADKNFVVDGKITYDYDHSGSLEHQSEVAATCTDDGCKEYWKCTCGRIFGDVNAKQETSLSKLKINALGHNFKYDYDWKENVDGSYSCKAIGTCTHKNCTATNTSATQAQDGYYSATRDITPATYLNDGYITYTCKFPAVYGFGTPTKVIKIDKLTPPPAVDEEDALNNDVQLKTCVNDCIKKTEESDSSKTLEIVGCHQFDVSTFTDNIKKDGKATEKYIVVIKNISYKAGISYKVCAASTEVETITALCETDGELVLEFEYPHTYCAVLAEKAVTVDDDDTDDQDNQATSGYNSGSSTGGSTTGKTVNNVASDIVKNAASLLDATARKAINGIESGIMNSALQAAESAVEYAQDYVDETTDEYLEDNYADEDYEDDGAVVSTSPVYISIEVWIAIIIILLALAGLTTILARRQIKESRIIE